MKPKVLFKSQCFMIASKSISLGDEQQYVRASCREEEMNVAVMNQARSGTARMMAQEIRNPSQVTLRKETVFSYTFVDSAVLVVNSGGNAVLYANTTLRLLQDC